MTGTLINAVTVLIGSGLGTVLGGRLPARVRETVIHGLGLMTIVIGMEMAFSSANVLILLGSILVGGMLGEWWGIEAGLNRLGSWLEARVSAATKDAQSTQDALDARQRFIQGYVTASLVFCVGPLTIVGSIQDGLTGDYTLLAIKSMLDGFAALAFSASLGIGVAFAVITILVYQGGLSLAAAQAEAFLTEPMITEMTAAGGVLIMGLGISSLLQLREIRVGNYLPALVIAPGVVAVLTALGLPVTPF
jgi:uncharacterized membrane protein YqgA involved in biofilm formation